MYDHWTEENPDAYFPRMKAYVAENTDRECGVVQTRYLQNAAYMRLKNLTVGYTLPKVLLNKIGIERLRIFFSGDVFKNKTYITDCVLFHRRRTDDKL